MLFESIVSAIFSGPNELETERSIGDAALPGVILLPMAFLENASLETEFWRVLGKFG